MKQTVKVTTTIRRTPKGGKGGRGVKVVRRISK